MRSTCSGEMGRFLLPLLLACWPIDRPLAAVEVGRVPAVPAAMWLAGEELR